ncbi:START-like domain-containing protein [Capnocytophaga catalasegens]|uniref:START-like domain-containing protein n=1 Tax=Capnocytophaga catalasegens TaxID=1004260 RepID=A0AAV5ATS7_9FLAO|nr:START-like domain-containing protein [Capnocytophaga catalasegens]GIZ14102.1 hypothetical protein RCZ03_01030 [Capnocytophaga catalasegens]GJM49100.1 hypothetical protein RCZ15_00760 [Capnocytophaga catalasegens]GJM52361.1 hypothetical protein RCZ16_06790 [Capnocytophaga catalasegens]
MQNYTKYELEYPFHASPQLLYQYISTPSGLSEWFADNVNSRGELYTFIWEDTQEQAHLIRKRVDELVKFRWLHHTDECFFEMRIMVDELTQDVSLLITDFIRNGENLEEAKLFWNNQITDLKHVLGSY